MKNRFDVAGKVALVTGSSRGLGYTQARGLAAAGARVVVNGRDPQTAEGARRRLVDEGFDASATAFDIASGEEVVRGMKERGHGKIVNICSLQSELGRATIAPYAASKGGLKMLTRGMTVDWAKYGIQINGIGPGYLVTEMTQPLKDDPDFDRWIRGRTPAGRWGDPEELLGALLFFASSASDFVNGQLLYVDGGITAAI